MAFGCVESFLAIALPKYQQSNPTGVILDLNLISWIGKKNKYRFPLIARVKQHLTLRLPVGQGPVGVHGTTFT